MPGGVVDTLRISYVVDVADKATKPLLANERAIQKSVARTSTVLARQDAAVRRSGVVATATSARKTAALTRESRAAGAGAGAISRLTGVEKTHAAAASKVASTANAVTAAYQRQAAAAEKLTVAERARAAASKAALMASAGAATAAKGYAATAGARAALGRGGSGALVAAGAGAAAAGRGAKGAAAVGALGLGVALSQAIKFDKAMRNVNSIAQLSEKQFAALAKQVRGLAGTTAQTPQTLAEGLYDLVSSGFDARESLHILEKAARAATAGLTTTEVSTAAVAAVLNAYRLPATAAGKVSDQLFKTVDRGVISFEQLASNIGTVLPVAASLGVGLDQVGAALATMTKQGIGPEEAVVRLQGAMTKFIKPSETMSKALKRVGADSGESLIRQRGLQGAIEAVAGATDGSKEAFARLFPDVRAMQGALALTGRNAASAKDDIAALGDASGATARALSQQSKSVAMQWQAMKAQASSLAIAVGSKLIPALSGALKGMNAIVRGRGRTGGAIKDFLGGLTTAPRPAGRSLTQGGQERDIPGSARAHAATAARARSILQGSAERDIPRGIRASSAAAARANDPSAAQKLGERARGVLVKLGDTAKRIGPVLMGAGRQLLDAFKPAMPFLRNVLLPLLEGLGKGVIAGIVGTFKVAVPIIRIVATALGYLGRILAPLKGVFRGIGTVIGFVFSGPIFLKIAGVLGKVGSAFKLLGAPIRLIGTLFRGLGSVVGFVGRAFGAIAGKIGGALRAVPGIVGRVFTNIYNFFRRGAKKLSSYALDAVTSVAGRFGSLGRKIIDKARAGLTDIYAFFKRLGGGIVKAIVGVIKDAPGKIKDALLSLIPGPVRSVVGRVFGGRSGGRVTPRGFRRYQSGGLVPIAAAGGELLVHRGRSQVIPGREDRDGTFMLAPPGASVLTYDGQARMAAGESLSEAIRSQAPHFAKGGKVPKYYGPEKITPGRYSATSYGPPWGGIQGKGITRTGIDLRGGPRRYIVAVDPALISLKSKLYVQPNPFGYRGAFSAEDTGGQIKGRRLDFYDWRGRARQNTWGRRQVQISTRAIPKTSQRDDANTILGGSRRRAGLIDDAFAQGRQAGQEGLTRTLMRAEGNPMLTALREQTQTPASSTGGGRAVSTGAGGGSVALTRKVAASTRVPYVFGGGHSGFSVKGGADCSGYVSYIASKAGWQPRMTAPMATGALSGYGRPGRGKHVTIHVRNGGPAGGHTALTIDGRGYSSGNRRTGRLSGRYDMSAAYLRTLPIKRHPIGMRAGGTIGRLTAGATGAGPALSGGLRRAMSMAGGSLQALDEIIGRALEQRLLAMRAQLLKRVQAGGPRKVIERLQSVISLIDGELGRRVGRIEAVVQERTAAMERGRGIVDRMMRARGINAESSQGIGVMQAAQAAETRVREQNVTSLQSALRRASAARNRAAVKEITDALHTAQDELSESIVRQIELARDAVRAAGAERISGTQAWLGLMQTGVGMIEARQRLNRSTDTPEGMRERAGAIEQGVIPALRKVIEAQQANAWNMLQIGDVEGWRQGVQDAAASVVDLANAQADAADLIRDAAAKVAQDLVDAAAHRGAIAGLGLQRLELEQRLSGTFGSAGGAQARADFIRQQIIPALDAEIIALETQRMDAQRAGNADLVRQLQQQIFAKTNEILQSQLDAQEQTAENTELLKEFGGSTAFSYRDQLHTDLDVIAARGGA